MVVGAGTNTPPTASAFPPNSGHDGAAAQCPLETTKEMELFACS